MPSLAPLDLPDTDERLSRKIRQRRCVATREVMAMDRLLRFVLAPDGTLTPDLSGKLPGRGAHLSPTRAALAQAIKTRAFDRAFKQGVRMPPQLADHLADLIQAHLLARLSLARRSGDLALGHDAVFAAASRGKLTLLILPSDATANTQARLAGLARDFPALTFATVEVLGAALGKPRVTNLAFIHAAKGDQFWALAHKFRDFLPLKFHEPRPIPAAIQNDSYVRWYKGRDCGPRSGPEISAKAPRGTSEGPVGGETRSVSAARHKTAKKVSTFFAVGISDAPEED